MNQKRQTDYQWLINTLLTCPSQKIEILQANLSLLDAGLVRAILEIAERRERWGDKNSAYWLKDLATQLVAGMGKSLATITMEAEADQLVCQAEERHKFSEYKNALELWQKAVNIYREIGSHLGEGSALIGLGICHDFLGKYLEAIDYYQQALEIAHNMEGIAGKAGKGICLGNIGKSFASLGEYQKAVEYHKQSLEIAREISNHNSVVTALGNLGYSYYSLGKYKQAIECHQEQLNLAQEISNRIEEINALGSLGLVFYFIGQIEQATDYYQMALTIAQEIGARAQEASSLSNLAACYSFLGSNDKAVDYFQQSLEIQREISDRFGEATSQSGLGMTYRLLGQYTKAIECYQVALGIVQEIGDCSGQANYLSNLGSTYNLLGQYRDAIEYCKQALSITQEIGDRRGEGFALDNLGVALFSSGQLTQSEIALCTAIEVKESLRVGLEDTHKVSIFDTQADTYSLLQQVLVLQYRPNEALKIAERGRARAFVDLLYERSTNTSKGTANEISQAKTIQSPTLSQIQQITQARKVTIVEYSIINSDHLFVWVINPTGEIAFCPVYLQPLKRHSTSLENLVVDARKFSSVEKNLYHSTSVVNGEVLSSIEPTTYQALQQLYEYLIQPIFHLLPTNPGAPIVLIPHGSLFLVPFPALQDSTGKFLVEHYEILTAPSIQVLDLICEQRERVKNQEWGAKENLLDTLVVGNPTMPIIPLTDPPTQLQELTWAQTEAEAIASLLNTVAITGEVATKVTVQESMVNARLIHLATHGLLDDIRQLGVPGAIALAPSKDDNGFLTTIEILEMQLNAELVVLSACSTGQGKITGDGVIGLSRSLIAAGVPSVIVSLWSVNDQSTAFLMIRFYQNLQQGMMPVTALNDAQRWLMKITKSEMTEWINANQAVLRPTLLINLRRKLKQLSDNERPFRDPFHWAAFYAIGQ